MTSAEILEKAIQKAVNHGFELPFKHWEVSDNGQYIKGYNKSITDGYSIADFERIIFNHDFARAVWGEWDMVEAGNRYTVGSKNVEHITTFEGKSWQYHLQQMVIADDPIKYLGEHLGENPTKPEKILPLTNEPWGQADDGRIGSGGVGDKIRADS